MPTASTSSQKKEKVTGTRDAVTVCVNHLYATSPERVFDAWLDPLMASKWLFTTPTGKIVHAEIDARVGGKFKIVDRREKSGEEIEHVGKYLEIDRPRRLVFTFAVPKYSPDITRVTVMVAPAGSGSEVTLMDEGVPRDWAASCEEGWREILNGLARALGSGSSAAVS